MSEKLVPSSLPKIAIPDQSIGSLLLEKLLESSNSIVLIDCDKNKFWSGKQMHAACLNITAALITEIGLRPDDVVLFALPNTDVYAFAIIAVLAAGAVFCCVSPIIPFHELVNIVTIINPALIICSQESFAACQAVASQFSNIKLLLIDNKFNFQFNNEKISNIESFVNYKHNNVSLPVRSPKNPAALMMSSGTTGKPKAVVHSNKSILAIALTLHHEEMAYCKPTDIVMANCFSHISGIRALLHVMACRSKLALMPTDVWEEEFFRNVEKFRVTATFVVPSQLNYFAKHLDVVERYDISSLQDVMYGGSALSESVYNTIKEKFKFKKFRQVYGMTEVGWATQVQVSQQEQSLETIGTPTPSTEIKVISPEFVDLPANQIGEVCIRGPQVTPGYLNNEEANKVNFMSDGFFRSGDLGYYDEAGRLYLVGRIKEVLNVDSSIVSPAEIEGVLLSHPDICEAAVIGVADDNWGEIAKAFVVIREESVMRVSENDIIKFVEERVQVEKQLHGGVCFMKKLPKTSLGKIRRNDLKMLGNSN